MVVLEALVESAERALLADATIAIGSVERSDGMRVAMQLREPEQLPAS
jgi:hypothetical protein